MASVYVTKDSSSLYLTGVIENGDQLQYNWSLSQSYTLIVAKGSASVVDSSNLTHTRNAIGLYRVSPNEELNLTSTSEQCIIICPFLLNDNTTMDELFTETSTLSSLRNSSSYLIETTDLIVCKSTDILTSTAGDVVFSLDDLNTAVLGGLSI